MAFQNLYHVRVNNVDKDTEPKDFRALFQPYGSVKSRIYRDDNGWAVVSFPSEEKAKRAMQALSGRAFRNKTLTLEWASKSVRHPNYLSMDSHILFDAIRSVLTINIPFGRVKNR